MDSSARQLRIMASCSLGITQPRRFNGHLIRTVQSIRFNGLQCSGTVMFLPPGDGEMDIVALHIERGPRQLEQQDGTPVGDNGSRAHHPTS